MAAGLVLVIGIGLYAGGLLDGEEPAGPVCNGSEQLCDRTLDQVAFAATHNSMSAADQVGWKLTQQERGIPAQLDAGIRGLLIDMYYAAKTRRGIQNLPKRQIGLVGEVYLCHAVCGLGATRAADALRGVRDFLHEHPREVLVFSIEDHVRPPDIAQAFEQSGLARYVWRGPLGPGRFPTLREMIDRNQRVVVMAENKTGDVPWLRQQFDLVQETPYRFGSPAEVAATSSCRPNRGGVRNPLFLLNNWVDTSPLPQPRNAATVNAFETLLKRARTCARLRQRLPNLVAVDFFEQGDVVGVVRALNR